ncbi:MAG: ester cyclase [Solirubrobacterales bacterium]|nr:ester cyclase [Solirubrobacterales bacterium]
MAVETDLRARREAQIREHMESENRHDFDATIETMEHPRYEIVATGEVFDGEEAVRDYYARTRDAFPDQRNRLIAMHHADDATVVEFELQGTHQGDGLGVPATGRAFTCRMAAVFEFAPGGDRVVCERVYFDAATIARQLGLLD